MKDYGNRPYQASPKARRKAEELDVLLTDLQGSSPSGHIMERDVVTYSMKRRADQGYSADTRTTKATPLAKRIAEVEGLSLESLDGTGYMGKIRGEDVLQSLENRLETKRMTGMRRMIAEKMRHTWNSVPHVTLTTEAEVTKLMECRKKQLEGAERQQSVRVSLTDMIVKACAAALKLHPDINVSLEENVLHYYRDIHIGIAVALEGGLVIPVIKHADRKSVVEVATESKQLISKARSGGLQGDDMSGGRFTISNIGMYDIDAFTPIINLPESSILGVGRVVEKLLVNEGNIHIGQTMVLSLSFDHRVLDGAPAAAFLQQIKHYLESPTSGWM